MRGGALSLSPAEPWSPTTSGPSRCTSLFGIDFVHRLAWLHRLGRRRPASDGGRIDAAAGQLVAVDPLGAREPPPRCRALLRQPPRVRQLKEAGLCAESLLRLHKPAGAREDDPLLALRRVPPREVATACCLEHIPPEVRSWSAVACRHPSWLQLEREFGWQSLVNREKPPQHRQRGRSA